MTETIRAGREEPRMTDSQESMAQEKGSRGHQKDTLAGTDIQETTLKQGATTEKETTVKKGEEETMKKTGAEQMTETTSEQIGLGTEKEGQGTLQGETGEIRVKPERCTDLMKRETEKLITPEMRETEATQGTGITLDKETTQDTGMIPDQENTEEKGITQDQRKTQDSETTQDQRVTLTTETTPDRERTQEQETAPTATEEETQETLEAKAEIETHGRQCPSTRET